MCIPHGASTSIDNGYVIKKEKKHIKMVSKEHFKNGDPNFVDERVWIDENKEKKISLFERIFKRFS